MNLFSLLLRASRATVVLTAVAGLISAAASAVLLALIQAVLQSGAPEPAAAWGFAGLCVGVLVTRSLCQALLYRLSQATVYQVCLALSRQILSTPLRRLEEMGPHRILSTLTDDMVTIAQSLLAIPMVCVNAGIVLCCLTYLAWLSPPLVGYLLGFLVVGVASFRGLEILAFRHLRQAREERDVLLGHFRGMVEGIKQLQMHRRRHHDFLQRCLETSAASYRDHNTAGMTLYSAASNWGELLFLVCIGLLIFCLGSWYQIDRATQLAAALVILFVMAPIENIMGALPYLTQAGVAVDRVEALGLALGEQRPDTPPTQLDPPALPGRLELAGVSHAYHSQGEKAFVLGPLDLAIEPGELLFIVGGNGSGKTTLAKLLAGLYTPDTGEIRLDGVPAHEGGSEAYRRHFTAVFVDNYLFDSLLGLDHLELDARAREYLERFELAHKVEVKGGVFSTVDLSQGQRKRLSLLAAYLEDRPIYLFDEWAADQDPSFKDVFYKQLLPELKTRGKTVVVITHDDRYFGVADRVVKLEDGRIVPDAGRPELVAAADNRRY